MIEHFTLIKCGAKYQYSKFNSLFHQIAIYSKLKKKTIHCRAEKELFKCKNAKYSHIISRKDVLIDSQANQPIGKEASITKESDAKKKHTKLRVPLRSKKSTNTLISR